MYHRIRIVISHVKKKKFNITTTRGEERRWWGQGIYILRQPILIRFICIIQMYLVLWHLCHPCIMYVCIICMDNKQKLVVMWSAQPQRLMRPSRMYNTYVSYLTSIIGT